MCDDLATAYLWCLGKNDTLFFLVNDIYVTSHRLHIYIYIYLFITIYQKLFFRENN